MKTELTKEEQKLVEEQQALVKIQIVERYLEIKSNTPQFIFMDTVDIVDGFYKGVKGAKVYNELSFMPNPETTEESDGVVTSYEVVIFDEEGSVIDRREVLAKYLVLSNKE